MPSLREEEYLEAISAVALRNGYAKVNDISGVLGVAPASVTEMFRRLAEGGYVNYEKYSGVTLTKEGLRVVSRLSARHETILELLLLMGVDPVLADEDACRIEHTIQAETVECISRFLAGYQKNGAGDQNTGSDEESD